MSYIHSAANDKIIQKISEFCRKDSTNKTLFIIGEVGVGKSTLISEAIKTSSQKPVIIDLFPVTSVKQALYKILNSRWPYGWQLIGGIFFISFIMYVILKSYISLEEYLSLLSLVFLGTLLHLFTFDNDDWLFKLWCRIRSDSLPTEIYLLDDLDRSNLKKEEMFSLIHTLTFKYNMKLIVPLASKNLSEMIDSILKFKNSTYELVRPIGEINVQLVNLINQTPLISSTQLCDFLDFFPPRELKDIVLKCHHSDLEKRNVLLFHRFIHKFLSKLGIVLDGKDYSAFNFFDSNGNFDLVMIQQNLLNSDQFKMYKDIYRSLSFKLDYVKGMVSYNQTNQQNPLQIQDFRRICVEALKKEILFEDELQFLAYCYI